MKKEMARKSDGYKKHNQDDLIQKKKAHISKKHSQSKVKILSESNPPHSPNSTDVRTDYFS